VGALERAVGDHQPLGRLRREMRGGEFDHLARADEQHVQIGDLGEDAFGEFDRGGGHADRMGADLGLGAHLFGDRERALEQLVEQGADGAGFVGRTHRLLHLAEDLRFAEHHRIEAAGHAECMADRVLLGQRIQMGRDLFGLELVVIGQPFRDLRMGVGDRSGIERAIQLGAVAGRDNGRFLHRLPERRAQARQRAADRFGRETHALADRKRCGVMVESEREQ